MIEKIQNLHSLISEIRDAVDLINGCDSLQLTEVTGSKIKA